MTLRHYPGRTVADKFVIQTTGIALTPEVSRSQTTDLDSLFRNRCMKNPWIPHEAFEKCSVWTRKFSVLDAGHLSILNRGCRLNTFYLNPRQSANPKRDWLFLGSAINWAKHNGETLRHIHFILGDELTVELGAYEMRQKQQRQIPPIHPVATMPLHRGDLLAVERHAN